MIRGRSAFLQLIALVIVAFSLSRAARPQDAPCPKDGRPDCPRAVLFFHNFQSALAKNDRGNIARMMEYPFLASTGHKEVHISTPAKLLQHFDEIFDKGVRCEILGATERDVWGNSHGFTIRDGAIWFEALIPPKEMLDPKAPDFWSRGTFKVMTVNNDSYYPCLKPVKKEK